VASIGLRCAVTGCSQHPHRKAGSHAFRLSSWVIGTLDMATCHIFSASTGNPLNNTSQQLIEFTLGAAPVNPAWQKPQQPYYLFDPQNVDYDVSYVNAAFLPAVMEPFGNPLIGYIGAPSTVTQFNKAVTGFLGSANLGKGWPRYIGGNGSVVAGKVPSALEIFAQSVANDPGKPDDGQWVSPPKFTPAPATSAPIKALINRWQTCQQGDINPICTLINDVTKLLRVNFANYIANYHNNEQTG
jgi:hypothetical protein